MSKELQTPLGVLKFRINGIEQDIVLVEMPLTSPRFVVDKRYKAVFDLSIWGNKNVPMVVETVLESDVEFRSGPSTGERLALIDFECNDTTVSVSFRGDDPDKTYEYLHDRIRITIGENYKNHNSIVCYIAWLMMEEPYKRNTYTWYAAHPD